jgi:hypothetical protein
MGRSVMLYFLDIRFLKAIAAFEFVLAAVNAVALNPFMQVKR